MTPSVAQWPRQRNVNSSQSVPRQFNRPPERNWSWAHDQLVAELSGMELKVYLRYKHYFNHKKQAAWPKQATIAKDLTTSVETVGRAYRKLVRRGLLEGRKTRGPNRVKVLEFTAPYSVKNDSASSVKNDRTEPDLGNQTCGVAVAPPPSAGADVLSSAAAPERGSVGAENAPPLPRQGAATSTPAHVHPRSRSHQGRSRFRWQRTPVQKAAELVMKALLISPALWRTREAIAHAIGTWMHQHPGKGPEWAVNPLVARWKDYETAKPSLRFPWSPLTFFGENHWQDPVWPVDREAQRRAELLRNASAGTYRPPSAEEEARWKAEGDAIDAHEAAGERWSFAENRWIPADAQ
jgi:Helix-turn-helix domain